MSIGTLCCCISQGSDSLFFVLTIDCLVHCKSPSYRFETGAKVKTHPVFVLLCLLFTCHFLPPHSECQSLCRKLTYNKAG